MTKRLYIILFFIFATLFLGCSQIEEHSKHVGQETGNAEQEENTDNKDEEVELTNSESSSSQTNNNQKEPINDLTVHYIDADQGDATLFQSDEFTILYDAGDWKDDKVINYLKKSRIEHLDLIIISHPHADHIGQLDEIMNSLTVDEVWMTKNVANTKVFQRAVNAILESEANFYEPEAGEKFDIDSMEIVILHPETLTGGLNEDSLSARFTYGSVSFIFTGDAYKNEELQMIKRDYPLAADFLQLGHHGSNTSSHPDFIEAVNPTHAIYSAGLNNQYGHPHEEIVNYFNTTDIDLLGTDVHGTIKVITDGETYDVLTEKEGKIIGNSENQSNDDSEKVTNTQEKTNNENCIDINKASQKEIKQIIHIGDKRAEDLINIRPYQTVDELIKVDGIGESRLKDIKEQGLACVN